MPITCTKVTLNHYNVIAFRLYTSTYHHIGLYASVVPHISVFHYVVIM